jgi:hypothetical protein
MNRRPCALAIALSAACPLWACADPVRDEAIEILGPESPSVEAGPRHRPGQPCVGPCHDGGGPGDSVFSLGGTVYRTSDRLDPLPDALLHFIDSAGQARAEQSRFFHRKVGRFS